MGRRIALVLAVGLLLGLCSCSGDSSDSEGYLETMVKQPRVTKRIMGSIVAQKTVDGFVALKGRRPESIEELEEAMGPLPQLPEGKRYSYDPESGRIEVVDD